MKKLFALFLLVCVTFQGINDNLGQERMHTLFLRDPPEHADEPMQDNQINTRPSPRLGLTVAQVVQDNQMNTRINSRLKLAVAKIAQDNQMKNGPSPQFQLDDDEVGNKPKEKQTVLIVDRVEKIYPFEDPIKTQQSARKQQQRKEKTKKEKQRLQKIQRQQKEYDLECTVFVQMLCTDRWLAQKFKQFIQHYKQPSYSQKSLSIWPRNMFIQCYRVFYSKMVNKVNKYNTYPPQNYTEQQQQLNMQIISLLKVEASKNGNNLPQSLLDALKEQPIPHPISPPQPSRSKPSLFRRQRQEDSSDQIQLLRNHDDDDQDDSTAFQVIAPPKFNI